MTVPDVVTSLPEPALFASGSVAVLGVMALVEFAAVRVTRWLTEVTQ